MRFATPALAAATSLLLHPAAVDAAVLAVSPIEYPAGVPMQLTVSHDAPRKENPHFPPQSLPKSNGPGPALRRRRPEAPFFCTVFFFVMCY